MIDKNYDPMRETGLNFDDELGYRGAMTKALFETEASDPFGGLLEEKPITKSARTTWNPEKLTWSKAAQVFEDVVSEGIERLLRKVESETVSQSELETRLLKMIGAAREFQKQW